MTTKMGLPTNPRKGLFQVEGEDKNATIVFNASLVKELFFHSAEIDLNLMFWNRQSKLVNRFAFLADLLAKVSHDGFVARRQNDFAALVVAEAITGLREEHERFILPESCPQ